jgi:hypothetical protein
MSIPQQTFTSYRLFSFNSLSVSFGIRFRSETPEHFLHILILQACCMHDTQTHICRTRSTVLHGTQYSTGCYNLLWKFALTHICSYEVKRHNIKCSHTACHIITELQYRKETDLPWHRLDVISKINVEGSFLWAVILRSSLCRIYSTQRRMEGRQMNDELGRILKEAAMA